MALSGLVFETLIIAITPINGSRKKKQ